MIELFQPYFQRLVGVEVLSILDVGCGCGSPFIRDADAPVKVGVDGWAPWLREAQEKWGYVPVHTDLRDSRLPFFGQAFDLVVAFDLLEHLKREDGRRLLAEMKRVTKKLAVVLTPYDPADDLKILHQEHNPGYTSHDEQNPFQHHLSGWPPEAWAADWELVPLKHQGIHYVWSFYKHA